MALVKILANNLFAGAGFQKLDAGKVYNVDDAVADKWVKEGKAESTKEKGETLQFEVSTPSAPVSADTTVLQSKLNDVLEQLAEEIKLRDEARNRVTQIAEQSAEDKIAFDEKLAAMTKRAKDAETALAEAQKKGK